MEVKEIHRKPMNKMAPEKRDEMIKKLEKEHDKPIKGMFEFIDAQGGWLDFSYRFFPGHPIQTFRFIHGEICEIPMGIVKHLNNIKAKVRKLNNIELSANGKAPVSYEVRSRVRFTPMDVM